MNKLLLSALLFLSIPTTAIADNLPANYMVWRGKTINLDYLWGKGVAPVAPQTTQVLAPIEQPIESREVIANKQRVEFENARSQLLIERLRNMP